MNFIKKFFSKKEHNNGVIIIPETTKQELSENLSPLERVSEKMKQAMQLINVTESDYQEIYLSAMEDEDSFDEFFTFLEEKGYITYIDYATEFEDVLYCLNLVAEKQGLPLIPEDLKEPEGELLFTDALNDIVKQYSNMYDYVLIDNESEGCLVVLIAKEKADSFIAQMTALFTIEGLSQYQYTIKKLSA